MEKFICLHLLAEKVLLKFLHAATVALGGGLVVDQGRGVVHPDHTLGLLLHLGIKGQSKLFW